MWIGIIIIGSGVLVPLLMLDIIELEWKHYIKKLSGNTEINKINTFLSKAYLKLDSGEITNHNEEECLIDHIDLWQQVRDYKLVKNNN